MSYYFNKHIRNNDKQRRAYSALARETFGISFEEWYQNGYWTECHMPYTLFDGEQAIANVSVNRMQILREGTEKIYIQLGTVMTKEEYRNRGLSRRLMEEVMKDWAEKCDAMFLFANETVLDFYPKFGFEKGKQYQYSKRFYATEHMGAEAQITREKNVRKLNMDDEADRNLLQHYYEKSNPFSAIQVVDNFGLLMFYCGSFMRETVYFLSAENAIVIAEEEKNELHCYDVYCDSGKNLSELLAAVAGKETERIVLGFTPVDADGWNCEQIEDDADTLFVLKGKENIWETGKLYFPEISHT